MSGVYLETFARRINELRIVRNVTIELSLLIESPARAGAGICRERPSQISSWRCSHRSLLDRSSYHDHKVLTGISAKILVDTQALTKSISVYANRSNHSCMRSGRAVA